MPTPALLKNFQPQRHQGAPRPRLGSCLPFWALLKSHTQLSCQFLVPGPGSTGGPMQGPTERLCRSCMISSRGNGRSRLGGHLDWPVSEVSFRTPPSPTTAVLDYVTGDIPPESLEYPFTNLLLINSSKGLLFNPASTLASWQQVAADYALCREVPFQVSAPQFLNCRIWVNYRIAFSLFTNFRIIHNPNRPPAFLSQLSSPTFSVSVRHWWILNKLISAPRLRWSE